MQKSALKALLAVLVMAAIGLLLACAVGRGLPTYGGLSMPLWSLLIAFGVQWLVFIPAYLNRTERFYDLTGAVSNIAVVIVCFNLSIETERNYLLASLIVIWALRLGGFLFWRVCVDGRDTRFDKIKINFYRFLVTWTLQALWVFLISLAAILAMASGVDAPLGWTAGIGVLCWLLGMALEVTADVQKRRFRADSRNQGQFIRQGLWAWSRHPNYFGEILVWIGVCIIAFPALSGCLYLGLLSPLFVILVLTKVTGIPLLEASANRRWGSDSDYQQYKAQTPLLIPRIPRP
ncbi:DUF1295 domain-containing protein [Zhongshania sp.]|jgi:steroid 5-alpha reductase family enzyme|uniref:DUF1295 domain-containing protein n=1 Tax=Zhongshania sp. TaxID=1971902 RepID=UPI002A7FD4CB|nr:DUF1295 domain-containing protein [Zhongshania sp.]